MLFIVTHRRSLYAGTTGFGLLTFVTAVLIIGTTLSFVVLLAFEVYRSIKFAAVNAAAHAMEVEAAERAATRSAGALKRVSNAFRRRSSALAAHARQSIVGLGRVPLRWANDGNGPAGPSTGGAADVHGHHDAASNHAAVPPVVVGPTRRRSSVLQLLGIKHQVSKRERRVCAAAVGVKLVF